MKHNKEYMTDCLSEMNELREFFIKRMTVDSETTDARRKEFNQAIFCDYGFGVHEQVYTGTTMEMVLECFDNAVKDWKRNFRLSQ